MLIPSKVHHRHCHDHCKPFVPGTFGILCWNVYKQNQNHPQFKAFLEETLTRYPADFLLFQEAHFKSNIPCTIESFSYDAAANLAYRDTYFGVLTASRSASTEAKAYLSEAKEAYIGTHKSMLLTTYTCYDGGELLIVNVHAINFRETPAYEREIDRLITFLSRYKGRLIVAGDFNTWNHSRLQKLFTVAQSLGLKHIPLGKDENVKTMFGNPLDLLFYRDLELLSSRVIDDGGISDHRPLYAFFRWT